MYRGKKKRVEDLSPTSGYKVDVQCPECGTIRNVFYRSVRKAGHTMCQSCSVKKKMGKTIEKGKKFGRLAVLRPSQRSGFSICKCKCDEVKEVDNYELISGGTRSCGCLQREIVREFILGLDQTGDKHPNWRGGISGKRHAAMSRQTYKSWRISVYERDDYTCQKCGQVGRKLNAHHIYNYADYPELRLDASNGITFCEECHREFHSINGLKTNKKQLDEFLR